MRRSLLIGLTWIALGSLLAASMLPAAGAGPGPERPRSMELAQGAERKAGDRVPGRYIVTFRQDVFSSQAVSSLRRQLNLSVDLEFERALSGFAAKLTPAQVSALEADPRVQRVEPDIWFEAHEAPLPTGVDRIGADSVANGVPPTRAGAAVAVLDTGVANHPDLNVAGGYNCTGRDETDYGDRDGHGTHVAGTIGASGGIAGVAPGTPIWAVKVLDDNGSGLLSWVICGLDWVVDNQAQHGIVAINMSLGAPDSRRESATSCGSSGMHLAICSADEAGLAVVVSAGNDNENAAGTIPAKYSQVITVAAMTDTDGCAGGYGGRSSWGRRDKDDRKWIHSNFGEAVDVIAPGVDILSTVPGGEYRRFSGTSMAAPHVTGAIALGWDPATGPRELGIPGFSPDLGLVQLSSHTSCWGMVPEDPDRGGATNPKISIGPKSAPAGHRVRVRLHDYPAEQQVRILLNGRRVETVAIGANGSGTGRFRIPGDSDAGRYVVRGIGAGGGLDSTRLRVKD